jgi:hypothetical protein
MVRLIRLKKLVSAISRLIAPICSSVKWVFTSSPDLVGDSLRAVLQPGGGLGQRQCRALRIGVKRRLTPRRYVVQPLVGITGLLSTGDTGVDARRAAVDLAGAQMDQREQLRVDAPGGNRLLQVPDRLSHVGVDGVLVLQSVLHGRMLSLLGVTSRGWCPSPL